MNASKLSRELADRLAGARSGEVVDVVVELQPRSFARDAAASRAERVAAAREAFRREAAPVETAIRSAGGEVLGAAWINQTVRARIPADRIARLAELAEVHLLDVPRALKLGNA